MHNTIKNFIFDALITVVLLLATGAMWVGPEWLRFIAMVLFSAIYQVSGLTTNVRKFLGL